MSIYSPYLYHPFREDANKLDQPFHVYKKIVGLVNIASKEKSVNDFNEFCKEMGYDPISVLYTFHYNHLEWMTNPTKFVFWPDMIIQQKKGRCFDFALFMHYYFQYFEINHMIGFISLLHPKTFECTNHAFPIYQNNSGNYDIWQYSGGTEDDLSLSMIFGNVDSPFELLEKSKSIFAGLFNIRKIEDYDTRLACTCYMTEKEMEGFDKFKNKKNIYQQQLLNLTDKHHKMAEQLDQIKQRMQKRFIAYRMSKEERIQD